MTAAPRILSPLCGDGAPSTTENPRATASPGGVPGSHSDTRSDRGLEEYTAIHSLSLVPITLRDACAFIAEHHRHHDPPRGCILTVGAATGDRVVGVCVVGRPVARMLQDGFTAEVTRVATDGARNANSFLYGAAWRACRALGYRRLVTYTLPGEGGASLRAAGWTLLGEAGGGSWSRRSRPRVDHAPTQVKLAWQVSA